MKHKRFLIIFLVSMIMATVLIQITAFAADNFSSGGTVTPEQDVYYVGDTVSISDLFKNKSTSTATDVTVEYYYRLDGANSVYSGSPIDFGTILSTKSETYSFTYTFTDSDIGEYRIGAKITYTMGGVTYSEYSSGHDFIVEAAPTPTPSETPTAEAAETPAPTEEQEAESTEQPAEETEPEATLETIETFTPVPEDAADEESSGGISSILQDKTLVITLIIIAGVVIVLLFVLLIVLVAKKKR